MSTEAQKRAQANYQKKIKSVSVVFTLGETELYDKMEEKAKEQGITAYNWIKTLIREELEGH